MYMVASLLVFFGKFFSYQKRVIGKKEKKKDLKTKSSNVKRKNLQ
jgi:hypothetical protein